MDICTFCTAGTAVRAATTRAECTACTALAGRLLDGPMPVAGGWKEGWSLTGEAVNWQQLELRLGLPVTPVLVVNRVTFKTVILES